MSPPRLSVRILIASACVGATLCAAENPSTSTADASHAPAPASVSATDVWSRATTADAQTAVVYLTLVNNGDHDVQFTGASAAACDHVELHQSACCAGGEMTMQPVTSITVPAHGTLVLKPAGYHLMLIKPTHGLTQGGTLPLTLTVGGASIAVTAAVRSAGAMGPTD